MSENSPYLVFHDDFSLFFNENFSMKLQLPYQGLLFNENFSVTLPLSLIYGRSRLKKTFHDDFTLTAHESVGNGNVILKYSLKNKLKSS